MNNASPFELNFWPAFADLMLALVLILTVILFCAVAVVTAGTEDTGPIRESQRRIIESIAEGYRFNVPNLGSGDAALPKRVPLPIGGDTLSVKNNLSTQRITFSSSVLFPKGDYELQARGRSVLQRVGRALKREAGAIKSIQIQGYTDTDPTGSRYRSNLHLGAYRAIEVFRFLQNEIGISPMRQMISVSSFGKYMPVQRSQLSHGAYSPARLSEHNSTPAEKRRNRRIELLLTYADEAERQE